MFKKIVFLVIILIAIILRFYQLSLNPPSLSWDEVALGYNAYSIVQTGRDEFGRLMPADYFASFGDYKPPVYVYAAVLPIKIFGLNEFAIRFPSALFGTMTVLLTYFLVKELFPKLKDSWLPEIATLFLAISPWHTQLSRAAWEANLALFFVVLAVLLFATGVRKNKGILLIFSAISLVVTFYTFNSNRIFSPLLALGLVIGYRRQIYPLRKWLLAAGLIVFVLLLPLLPHLFSPEGRLRFQEVNIFTDIKPIEITNRWMEQDNNTWWSRIIHNRRIYFSSLFLEHYFHHFTGKFLFISGDGNPKFSLQDVGQLYLVELPFLLAGTLYLILKKEKAAFLIFWWLLTAIAPAGLARETPHALRILNSLPTWQIITAYGFLVFLQSVEKRKTLIKNFLLFTFCLLLFLNVFYYLHNYYSHYPTEYSGEWQYGYKEAVNTVEELEDNYDRVVMTKSLGRPYIYFLFYKKYPPQKFWQYKDQIIKEPTGFVEVRGFDKYEFRGFNGEKDGHLGKTLFITNPIDVPEGANVLKTIQLLNGKTILTLFDLK